MWASVLGPGPTWACSPCPVHFAPSRRAEEGVAFLQKGSGVELDTTGSFLVGACSSQPLSLAILGQSSVEDSYVSIFPLLCPLWFPKPLHSALSGPPGL